MHFQLRHVNRHKMPTRHILVCEDDLSLQAQIAQHFAQLFEPQGTVVVSYVSGALAACSVLSQDTVDLILLDHDMPRGNGPDLMEWLQRMGRDVPVMTFSGIPDNNEALRAMGAAHVFQKDEVIRGDADPNIRSILGLPPA
jgi:CheY-like chemotaxis protein